MTGINSTKDTGISSVRDTGALAKLRGALDSSKASDSSYVKVSGTDIGNPNYKIGYSSLSARIKYSRLSDDVTAKNGTKLDKAALATAKNSPRDENFADTYSHSPKSAGASRDKMLMAETFTKAAKQMAYRAISEEYEKIRASYGQANLPLLSENAEEAAVGRMTLKIGDNVKTAVLASFGDMKELNGVKRVTVGDINNRIIPEADRVIKGMVQQFAAELRAEAAMEALVAGTGKPR